MKRNSLMKSDVVAGLVLVAAMVTPILYYSYAALEIAAGRYLVGGDLKGVYATDIPHVLDAGPLLYGLGIPTVVAYVTWMLLHRYAGVAGWIAVIVAIPISLWTGYSSTTEALIAPEEVRLAMVSSAALLVCAALVFFEFFFEHKRSRPTA